MGCTSASTLESRCHVGPPLFSQIYWDTCTSLIGCRLQYQTRSALYVRIEIRDDWCCESGPFDSGAVSYRSQCPFYGCVGYTAESSLQWRPARVPVTQRSGDHRHCPTEPCLVLIVTCLICHDSQWHCLACALHLWWAGRFKRLCA